jgi:hypothetical protein
LLELSSLVYWFKWWISATDLPRRHKAISSALLTAMACIVSLIDLPTMRLAYKSITAAAKSQPSPV